MRVALCLLALLAQGKPPAKPAGPWPPPALDEKSYKKWSEFIRPSPDEMKWKKIPWRTDLVAAVAEGKALNRPILLWSDQGNPLGLVEMAPSINTCIARRTRWPWCCVRSSGGGFWFTPVHDQVFLNWAQS